MRRIMAALVALLMCQVVALADPDLAAMSVDELRQLRDAVNLELASRCQDDGALASWDTPAAHVELLRVEKGLTHESGEGILLIFSYRNMGQDVDYFRASHWVNVYQAGVECERTIAINGEMNIVDTWSIKVLPGAESTEMRWAVQLRGESDVIDVEIEDRTAKPWKSAGIVTIALPD